MKRSWRRLFLGLAAFGAVGAAGLWVELVLTRGRTPRIATPGGIASLETIPLGGVKQWVLIRGQDRTRPLLLFLHGGPGMPAMYLAHVFQAGLERDFVVVHWDRRGAGKSFDAGLDMKSLTVSQTLADALDLSRTLRRRFGQDRLYLVGHSWGTYLGLLAARDHPEYYAAYIGMGLLAGTREQVIEIRREFLGRKAKDAGDGELVSRLASTGYQPSEDDLFRHGGELRAARSFWPILWAGLRAPEYTLHDALNVKKGADLVARAMKNDVLPRPLEGEIGRIDVPVFLFLGRHDYNTPASLAAEYLERLDAPLKEAVWFENSAHFPFFEEPERFHSELVRVEAAVRRSASERRNTRSRGD